MIFNELVDLKIPSFGRCSVIWVIIYCLSFDLYTIKLHDIPKFFPIHEGKEENRWQTLGVLFIVVTMGPQIHLTRRIFDRRIDYPVTIYRSIALQLTMLILNIGGQKPLTITERERERI